MFKRSARAATLKYFTLGKSGVEGLNNLVQKCVVKFEYAGESSILKSKVVMEAGRVASILGCRPGAVVLPGGGGDSGVDSRASSGDLSV
jgi:hypothetical protein